MQVIQDKSHFHNLRQKCQAYTELACLLQSTVGLHKTYQVYTQHWAHRWYPIHRSGPCNLARHHSGTRTVCTDLSSHIWTLMESKKPLHQLNDKRQLIKTPTQSQRIIRAHLRTCTCLSPVEIVNPIITRSIVGVVTHIWILTNTEVW